MNDLTEICFNFQLKCKIKKHLRKDAFCNISLKINYFFKTFWI